MDDPDDDLFFLLAVEVEAKYVITRDPHLLDVGTYISTNAIRPEWFMKGYRSLRERYDNTNSEWHRSQWRIPYSGSTIIAVI